MPDTLLWSDDFAYANDAALEAAYPYYGDAGLTGVDPGIDLVNPGMAGYATGIDSKGVSQDYGASINVSQWMINPTGRCFHFRGVWKQDGIDLFNAAQVIVSMGQVPADGSDFYGAYWQLHIRNASGGGDLTELQLTVRGGNGTIATYPTVSYSTGWVAGTLTPGSPNQIDVSGELSTLNEPSPGVFTANADGSVLVKVNGVTKFTWSGVVWNFLNPTATPTWNYFEMHPCGTFSGLRIWECSAATTTPTPPVNKSDPCCGSPTGTSPGGTPHGTNPGALPPENPFQPLPQWITGCDGGGIVPSVADRTDPESWATL